MIKYIVAIFITIYSLFSIAEELPPMVNSPQFMEGEVIVKYKKVPDKHKDKIIRKESKIVKLKVPPGQEKKRVKELKADKNVEFASLNGIQYPVYTPNDPRYPEQWHFPNIQADLGWDYTTGSGVVVGVCDTGVDITHPELQGQVIKGYNAVDKTEGINYNDLHGHGTSTTGLIVALTNNNLGVAGLAPDAKAVHCRVSNTSSGASLDTWIYNGITWAADQGVAAINVSYSGVCQPIIREAAKYAESKGAILVYSAGNSGRENLCGGVDPEDTIIVGATDETNTRTYFSTWGDFVDLVAPGIGILMPTWYGKNSSGYISWAGTSFSAPIVTGTIGLIRSEYPNDTVAQVKARLLNNVDDFGDSGEDKYYGAGRVNVLESVYGAISKKPIANFDTIGEGITNNYKIEFVNKSSDPDGTIIKNLWDFGDGTTSTDLNPIHIYSIKGKHTVTLIVEDNSGKIATITKDINAGNAVPTADFEYTLVPDTNKADLVDKSYDPDGAIVKVEYLCNVHKLNSTTHPFNTRCNFNDSGTERLTQTVTDDTGYTATKSIIVNNIGNGNINPTANFDFIVDGLTVTVFAKPTDPDNNFDLTVFSIDGTNYYDVDTVTHTYSEPGIYNISFGVRDTIGAYDNIQKPIVVGYGPGEHPKAAFNIIQVDPYTFRFVNKATDSDTYVSSSIFRIWDIDGWHEVSSTDYTYKFKEKGQRHVQQKVKDVDNYNVEGYDRRDLLRKLIVIDGSTNNNEPPIANFSPSITGNTVKFTDTSYDNDGNVVAWYWNFDDGNTSTEQNPTHTYSSSGTYNVKLQATDNEGSVNNRIKPITIEDTTPPPEDTLKPVIILSSPSYDGEAIWPKKVSGSVSDNVLLKSVKVYVDNKLVRSAYSTVTYNFNNRVKGKGIHTIKVEAIDTSDNISTVTRTFTLGSKK
jgi:PKD repeat protein